MNKTPQELKNEADEYLDNVKLYASHWGKALLIAGGTAFIAYKVINAVSAQKKKQYYKEVALKKQQTSLGSSKAASRIGKLIRGQLALFLVGVAKEQLSAALSKRSVNEEKVA